MGQAQIGMLIGGVVPSILFALGAVFQKLSNKTSLSLNYYLISVGLGVAILGLVSTVFMEDRLFAWQGSAFGILQGLCFGTGIVLFALGITRFNLPVSQLGPITSTTTLFVVFFGFVFFSEYENVNVKSLVAGAILIVIGAILVGRSS